MDDQIKETIRTVVREEMAQNTRNGTASNLFARTQNIIRNAASEVAGSSSSSSSTNTSQTISNNSSATSASDSGKKRTNPRHPWRFPPASKKKAVKSNKKSKLVKVLLIGSDLEGRESYQLDSSAKIMNGFAELKPDFSEDDVRRTLIEVFSTKYSDIQAEDFEFVSMDQGTISQPSVPPSFKWDFDGIKVLIGQGKLLCRLLIPALKILQRLGGEGTSNQSQYLTQVDSSSQGCSTQTQGCSTQPSQAVTSSQTQLKRLKEIFPEKPHEPLQQLLEMSKGDLNIAVSSIIGDGDDDCDDEIELPSLVQGIF